MFKTQWYKEELQNSDSDIKHRSLSEEYSFFEAVKDGNIEFVQKNCQEKAFINPEGMGILSKNSLTNLKYHFVITVALITRYCIDGGMETEQAYRLSDFYILHMDTCQSMKEISELHDVMAHDFTGKMRLLQKNAALSKPIAQCIDYIYAHISSLPQCQVVNSKKDKHYQRKQSFIVLVLFLFMFSALHCSKRRTIIYSMEVRNGLYDIERGR